MHKSFLMKKCSSPSNEFLLHRWRNNFFFFSNLKKFTSPANEFLFHLLCLRILLEFPLVACLASLPFLTYNFNNNNSLHVSMIQQQIENSSHDGCKIKPNRLIFPCILQHIQVIQLYFHVFKHILTSYCCSINN